MSATHDSNGQWEEDRFGEIGHRILAARQGHHSWLRDVSNIEGVALKSVLEKAGVEFGHFMRGKRLASCLQVEAADGYRASIALPEIDLDFTDKQIVLAFFEDGKPLDTKAGPYRIVIPDEKRMARWVRQVTKLKIAEVP